MDFTLPEHLPGLLADMDAFIEREIAPLQAENMQYFDQRREHARTDWDNGGIPARAWEDLLGEMRRRADAAGWLADHGWRVDAVPSEVEMTRLGRPAPDYEAEEIASSVLLVAELS